MSIDLIFWTRNNNNVETMQYESDGKMKELGQLTFDFQGFKMNVFESFVR